MVAGEKDTWTPSSISARMRAEIESKPPEHMEIVGEFDLNSSPTEKLVQILHEHSVNGVILSARRSFFEQVEAAIRACELEGVEAWLIADFFRTQISRTSFDDLYGRPILVFRTAPEGSWQNVVKQLIDVIGAILLLIILSPVMLAAAIGVKITSPGNAVFLRSMLALRSLT